ncbi:MAG: type I DNA topoisomerase [Clostridiales bacterium]|jgi:DNA topoisomerase-1|nr:type I DNA topoisomerase [Clostridiales bacterium]
MPAAKTAKPIKPAKKAKKAKYLVIVESPAKAKTLKKFLGDNYKIEASMGHVRDLPKSQLGVEGENFDPKYITIRGKGDVLKKLRKEASDAGIVYLATDPDREGEAISWHLLNSLNLEKGRYKRITFNEITKNAVKRSITEARDIDMNLVDAQQARRVMDRIVGYRISPLLWRKVRKRLSAGRVQSVTLRLICDRERDINDFVPEEYWTIDARLSAPGKKAFTAHFYGKAAGAKGKDEEKMELKSGEEADAVTKALKTGKHTVLEVKKGSRTRKPAPPFTTSTLQQEASKALNFAVSKTMMIAQQIYEGVEVAGVGVIGLVSYIRTDSTRISDEAFTAAKDYVTGQFGPEYAASEKPEHKAKGRVQDAHEAIRPTDVALTPENVKDSLSRDQFKLYSLIWERFTASCMTPAVYDTVSVKIGCGEYILKASGSKLAFDGYKRVYKKETDEADDRDPMPEAAQGDMLKLIEATGHQHFTQPPPRFTEASLVKTLEENGVGRPSTYSPTITTLVSRGYVVKDKSVLYPVELGELVNDIMENNFDEIVDIEFTSKMEDDLDKIEFGEMFWKDLVKDFYYPLDEKIKEAEERIGDAPVKDEETDIVCDRCGRKMVIKYGRFGKFLACPGFPECRNAQPYFPEAGVACPLCGGRVMIKNTKKGRKYFGCEHHPECSFMSWHRPTGTLCPRCGQPLVEKDTRKEKRVACTNSECGYFEVVEEEEDLKVQG